MALLGAGSLYVFLSADFIAVTQLLIYIGGVLVLILFAVMLTNRITEVNVSNTSFGTFGGVLLFVAVAPVLVAVATLTPWSTPVIPAMTATAARDRQRLPHEVAAPVRGRVAGPARDPRRRGRHRPQGDQGRLTAGDAMVTLTHFLVVGALLFSFGLVTVATRRNAVGVLMGVELILNGANVNFVAFNHYVTGGVSGQIFALFVIVLAAAEAAVGLAIVLAIFQTFKTIDVRFADLMRE